MLHGLTFRVVSRHGLLTVDASDIAQPANKLHRFQKCIYFDIYSVYKEDPVDELLTFYEDRQLRCWRY